MDEATRYIESLKDKNPAFNTILGESYLLSGKTDQAAASLDAAIGANATQPEPYLDRARMYINDHKPDQALDMLKKAESVAPGDLRAPLVEAQTLGDMGRYQEAIALYGNLLARDPDLDVVANNLAETIADYEYNDPAALQKAQRVAERFTGATNPLFLDTLAWVYYREGNIDRARAVMERAERTGGKLPPQVHYHYGAILLKAGKTDEAKTELKEATANNTSYPGLDEAKKLLAQP
jgi:tetratricopeptide (TPR) repeat protein